MPSVLLRPSALFVLIVFFCASFVLIYYDGYRQIYEQANLIAQPGEAAEFSSYVEKSRSIPVDHVVGATRRFQIRSFSGEIIGDARHKFRWLYKTVQSAIYESIRHQLGPAGVKLANYVHYLHETTWTLITLIFVLWSIARIRGVLDFGTLVVAAVAVFAYIAFLFTTPRMVDLHSVIEMGTIAAAIYFALQRRLASFIVILFIGVANRETGAALGLVYAAINWRTPWFWLPFVTGPLMLIGINLDLALLPEFFQISTYLAVEGIGYVNWFNIGQLSPFTVAFSILKVFLTVAPVVLIWPRARIYPVASRLMAIIGAYLTILLSGTFIGNLYPYLLLVPPIVILGVLAACEPAKNIEAKEPGPYSVW